MSDDLIGGPESASGVDWNKLQGRLLLVEPLSMETGVNTTFGVKDAVKAHVVELDGPDTGTKHDEVLIFPKVLMGQVKGKAGTGKFVLGRLGLGQAKPGQKPPHLLGDPTDADKDVAKRYLAANTAPPF